MYSYGMCINSYVNNGIDRFRSPRTETEVHPCDPLSAALKFEFIWIELKWSFNFSWGARKLFILLEVRLAAESRGMDSEKWIIEVIRCKWISLWLKADIFVHLKLEVYLSTPAISIIYFYFHLLVIALQIILAIKMISHQISL